MSQKNEPNNVISLNRNQMYKYEMHRNSKEKKKTTKQKKIKKITKKKN